VAVAEVTVKVALALPPGGMRLPGDAPGACRIAPGDAPGGGEKVLCDGPPGISVAPGGRASASTVWAPAVAPCGTLKVALIAPALVAVAEASGVVRSQRSVTEDPDWKPLPKSCTLVPTGPEVGVSVIAASAEAVPAPRSAICATTSAAIASTPS